MSRKSLLKARGKAHCHAAPSSPYTASMVFQFKKALGFVCFFDSKTEKHRVKKLNSTRPGIPQEFGSLSIRKRFIPTTPWYLQGQETKDYRRHRGPKPEESSLASNGPVYFVLCGHLRRKHSKSVAVIRVLGTHMMLAPRTASAVYACKGARAGYS